ncbi:hypothetical protein EZS27_002123 [termite gut metagenome]|uniref:ISAzo13 family transposase n=1 Tax=termite gut metagenome TaxID=433724 RepID=A0A5J4SWB7_9ZZZZ
MNDTKKIVEKIKTFLPYLDEHQKRIYLALEVRNLGRGGKFLIESQLGISHNTINKGVKELLTGAVSNGKRLRKEGGGRKKKINGEEWIHIKEFIEPHTSGDPESPLQWVSKSLRHISTALKARGIEVSHRVVGDSLKAHGFSLQANRKTCEGRGHADRDSQFEFINRRVKEYTSEQQPVISVDAKKRELAGNFKNTDVEWHGKNTPVEVNACDFTTGSQGVAIPYGIYDMALNKGWVNMGITKDTAEFAVQGIRNWWYKMGVYYHNHANSLLITADDDGSNSSKGKLWKHELQKFANETGMEMEVVHFPPGSSKWNKIEHRLFSYISKNWRGKPLVSYEIIVQLIGSAKTEKGLEVECELDMENYQTGRVIDQSEMENINMIGSSFHEEWNYRILPCNR